MSRPAEWRIGAGVPVRHVVETVDPKGRLHIPQDFRSTIGTDLLGYLVEPGRLRILAWEPRGPEIDAEYTSLAADDPLRQEQLDRLADLAHAYQHLTLNDGRVALPRPVQSHLEVRLGSRTPQKARELFVIRFPTCLETWSRRYAGRRLRRLGEREP